MMTPNARLHNPDPDYLRGLIEIIGMSQENLADQLNVNRRLFRMYIARRDAKSAQICTYPVQFCLEVMANNVDDKQFAKLLKTAKAKQAKTKKAKKDENTENQTD